MGQRIYSTLFENVTIAAVQDVFSLKAGAANGIELHQIELSAGAVTSPAEIRLRLKRLPATFTVGSGGTAPTIGATDSGDTKATTASARANDTTQPTTSGTAVTLLAWQWQILNIFTYLPARGACLGYCGNAGNCCVRIYQMAKDSLLCYRMLLG